MMVRNEEVPLSEALAFYASLSSNVSSRDSSTPQAVDGSSFSTDDTVDDADLAPTITGAFVFSFEMMPLRRKLGWFAGLSLSAKFRPGADKVEADIVLTLNPSHGVACDHLLFSFLPDSSAFAIRNLRKSSRVTLNGHVVPSKDWAAVLTRHATLTVGELAYDLVWNVPQRREKDFQSRRNRYTTTELGHELPIESVSSTPICESIYIGNWRLNSTAGKGTESVFFSAVGPHGELVVIKQVVSKDWPSAENADKEMLHYEDLRSRLRHYPDRQFIVELQDLICTSGRRSFEEVQIADIANLVISPLARGTFWDILIKSKDAVDRDDIVNLFAQTFTGVSALHEVGYVHRDLKPTNLGVVSLSPPRAVVLDVIQAKYIPENRLKGVVCTPGYSGTVGFHAPEMEVTGGCCGQPIDAFALGCTGFHLFTGRSLFKGRFNPFRQPLSDKASPSEMLSEREVYDAVLSQLQQAPKDSIQHLLYGLLQKSPETRLSVDKAVKHHALTSALHPERVESQKANQKRACNA
ncbi:hypothetical protein LTR62_002373 [Meristemomyces frigidus]|uniref:Protein kinase domain-containing protein n=1 Tax=Meristemomyces frigidus TaxID=1508187 RepID=A0AAN7TA81_9PEZI|nr:hypothetical protein LTR62_002373 [Meristemomyces frigidus]